MALRLRRTDQSPQLDNPRRTNSNPPIANRHSEPMTAEPVITNGRSKRNSNIEGYFARLFFHERRPFRFEHLLGAARAQAVVQQVAFCFMALFVFVAV